MQENYLVQLQSITFLGQTEEYWNLEFTDEFIRRNTQYIQNMIQKYILNIPNICSIQL